MIVCERVLFGPHLSVRLPDYITGYLDFTSCSKMHFPKTEVFNPSTMRELKSFYDLIDFIVSFRQLYVFLKSAFHCPSAVV